MSPKLPASQRHLLHHLNRRLFTRAAPTRHLLPGTPFVLICGDRELELFGRYDENQYLARMMKLVGHRQTYLYELDGHGHGGMVDPGFHILETHIRRMLGEKVNP